MNGPLSGIRILDLTSVISGPLATMTLADQGADVIKVEASSGDFSRHVATRRGGYSAAFLNNNRNKRSIVLDLKSREGRDALHKMVAQSDVFVQNFRPGVAKRLGFGEDALSKINPSLIYMSIAGFGFEGPLANRPVYDPLIQAISSLATVQAGSDENQPKLVRTILPDKLTGIQASQAITAALYHREKTGEGQSIRLSMLDTIVSFLWGSDMGGHTFVGDEVSVEEAQSFIDLIYEVADGHVSVAIMQDKHWESFAHAVGQSQLLEDARFATPELREVNRDLRLQATHDAIIDYEKDDLIRLLDDAGVPCAPVLTRTELREHPQVSANETLVEYNHPAAGRLRQAAPPARFSKTPTSTPKGAPALGEDTQSVLAEFGIEPW